MHAVLQSIMVFIGFDNLIYLFQETEALQNDSACQHTSKETPVETSKLVSIELASIYTLPGNYK